MAATCRLELPPVNIAPAAMRADNALCPALSSTRRRGGDEGLDSYPEAIFLELRTDRGEEPREQGAASKIDRAKYLEKNRGIYRLSRTPGGGRSY